MCVIFTIHVDCRESLILLPRMAYIEENLKVRSKPREDSDDEDNAHVDPQEALYNIADRWKVEKQKPTTDVGSVTNSLTMLTAIPEVDLGMECVSHLLFYFLRN